MSVKRVTLVAASLLGLLGLAAVGAAQAAPKRPNFVVIFTDDQDAIQNSTHPRYQPKLHQHIRFPGVELNNYFVTTPVCCPSRTNLWRGQFSHNTNFTDVLGPHGGYTKWKALGIDKSYLPVWLQGLGYNTYYVGKFLVDYSVSNYQNVPAGWTDIDALVTPYTFDYNNPGFSRNGATPNIYPGQYSTDVIADKAVAQIKSAVAAGEPFYAQISPIAPHTSTQIYFDPVANATKTFFYPPIPAPRHWELFSDATLPGGTANNNLYEANVADKPAWIRALPLAQQNNRTYLEEVYRLRLRSLASVDELIDRVVQTLAEAGVLDNTYLIYSADNGYHVGTHRFGAGKVTAYDEDLRVPFLIRGPGIKASQSAKPANEKVGLHVDFAPTILTLAGAGDQLGDKALDGTPLGLYANDDGTLRADYPRPVYHRNQFQGEFWGGWGDEVLHHIPRYTNNSWKAVRVYDEETGQAWKLIASCTNERELYDLKRDPGELNNIYNKTRAAVQTRLEALLAVLVVCKGEGCTNPWKVLHPDGSVSSWAQSLDKQYDKFYASVKPFYYKKCLPYQDYGNEVSAFRPTPQSAVSPASPARRRMYTWTSTDRQLADLVDDAVAAAAAAGAGAGAASGSGASAGARVNGRKAAAAAAFVAEVERHSVPVPPEVLAADVSKWFDNPLPLA